VEPAEVEVMTRLLEKLTARRRGVPAAQANPAAHEPTLAKSLNNLSMNRCQSFFKVAHGRRERGA